MINLLGISGSPVERSSTDILLQRLADSFIAALSGRLPVRYDFVKLNELVYRPCQSCGEAPEEGFCIFDDDLTGVYDKLERCDCLLFGTPIYFDSVSAQAKMFIDRCNCFRPPDFKNIDPHHRFIRKLTRRRPGVMVLVGGERGWFEGARRVVAGFFKWVEVTNEGMLLYRSPDFTRAGAAADDEQALAEAAALGQRLAEIVWENHDRP
jgi:multimeric flavodoxin WrbA